MLDTRQRARPAPKARTPPARWIGLWNIDPRPRAPVTVAGRRKWTKHFFFVSYSRADELAVQKLLEPAAAAGHAFWLDRKNLPVGGHWSGDIVAAIRASEAVILFGSANAFASTDVFREVATAGRYNKFILPVFLDETPAPDDFLYYLSIHQAVRVGAPGWREQFFAALTSAGRHELR
jgi:hypothetical protein